MFYSFNVNEKLCLMIYQFFKNEFNFWWIKLKKVRRNKLMFVEIKYKCDLASENKEIKF